MSTAPKQEPSESVFELLNGTRQCRLTDVAVLGAAIKVERGADGEKVLDFVHFHGRSTAMLTEHRAEDVCVGRGIPWGREYAMRARNPSSTHATTLILFQPGGQGDPLMLLAKPLGR